MIPTEPDLLRLMAVMAHPDDESFGVGGTLATYATHGIETYVLTATRGEHGRFFTNENRPSNAEVGRVREAELRAAARVLGVREVEVLDYVDGKLDQADPNEAVSRIVAQLRRWRPQVVITFDPFGAYGHPDHVAISQLTTAAVCAANCAALPGEEESHRVSKLYYFAMTARHWASHQRSFKRLTSTVDGVERQAQAWPEWAVSAEIDTHRQWERVKRAVECHRSQLVQYARLDELTQEQQEVLWGSATFYRVFSHANGGRAREVDLFAGLR
ncbi:MAG: PIG-L family deacetylase [Gemmatimonadota bacterium]